MKTLIAFITCCVVGISTAQISTSEREALIDFYTSTNGNEWFTPWDIEKPVSTWHGITIKDNKVIAIELGFNNLQGEIPETIANLIHLESLKLFFNQIGGTIPEEIGNLINLKVLDINSNNISGSIPSSIKNLSNLEYLLVSSNNLTGMLPNEIGQLNSLKTIVLFDNHFFGDLPYALTELSNLNDLIIANNNFNSESLQNSLAILSANGTNVDFGEIRPNTTNTEIATLVIDDEEN